ncbi:hypothetical protein R76727_03914 [Ralstonia mannitolilytica]|nr:hypothetical protein R76727_03914 [Ralstonia mannitolilytica]
MAGALRLAGETPAATALAGSGISWRAPLRSITTDRALISTSFRFDDSDLPARTACGAPPSTDTIAAPEPSARSATTPITCTSRGPFCGPPPNSVTAAPVSSASVWATRASRGTLSERSDDSVSTQCVSSAHKAANRTRLSRRDDCRAFMKWPEHRRNALILSAIRAGSVNGLEGWLYGRRCMTVPRDLWSYVTDILCLLLSLPTLSP